VHEVIGADGRMQDLDRPAAPPGGQELADQHSDSGTVQSRHLLHVEEQLDVPRLDQAVHGVLQDDVAILELETSAQLKNRDVADAPFGDPHSRAHAYPPSSRYLMSSTSFRASL